MKKSENILYKVLILLVIITILAVVSLTIISYQIGVGKLEQTNRSAIIGGLLSMAGGIAGAFGAYFIARMQMKKQLELQYKKEEEKMIKEVKINNYLKLLETGDNLLQLYNKLQFSLLKTLMATLINNISIVEQEKEISIQIQTIKELSTKISIYKIFFDNRVLGNFPNISQSVREMEDKIYRMFLKYDPITFDEKIIEDQEKLKLQGMEIEKEIKKIIEKPKKETVLILAYTNLNLKKEVGNV
ncbi:hypothetical protein ACIQGW_04360 [Lysinibacillus xylanilyticus]|uniref:hypothetical protein n=1 Tax=Lysinibacillus xylanilyticus TaxID=582475 RepID=UPI00380D14EE